MNGVEGFMFLTSSDVAEGKGNEMDIYLMLTE